MLPQYYENSGKSLLNAYEYNVKYHLPFLVCNFEFEKKSNELICYGWMNELIPQTEKDFD